MQHAIETEGLTRRFRRTDAVTDLTLHVPAGTIFALLGPNGAGKTTTMRMVMGLERPTRGIARVLGVDSRRLGPATVAQIGYVSENQQLPEWMTVAQLEAYCRPLYPTWDPALADDLRRQLDLDPRAKLKHLSRGMKVKAALLVSLAYRPKLLVLDEPFTGLDPVVRDDLIGGVLRLADQEQWTVFLSSHDMDDVERLADWVAFIDRGRLKLAEPTESLRARFRRLEIALPEGTTLPAEIPPTWHDVQVNGRAARLVETAFTPGTLEDLRRRLPGASVEQAALSLREIFVTIARAERGDGVRPGAAA